MSWCDNFRTTLDRTSYALEGRGSRVGRPDLPGLNGMNERTYGINCVMNTISASLSTPGRFATSGHQGARMKIKSNLVHPKGESGKRKKLTKKRGEIEKVHPKSDNKRLSDLPDFGPQKAKKRV